MSQQRKLAAIMFTDVVGYSALMSRNEKLALEILEQNRTLHKNRIGQNNGEYIKEIGDGTLAIFPSAWDAVGCALDLQNTVLSGGTYRLRIGIHIGDVVTGEKDVFGDAVNIAARIQGICDPDKIFISARILEDIKNKLETEATYIGEKLLKNIDHPIEIYAISATGKKPPAADRIHQGRGKREHFIYTKRSRLNKITKGTLFLLAGLILAALIILLFRPTLLNAFTEAGSTPIAVVSFENQTGDTTLNFLQKAIPNLLITNLQQSRLFQVITWDRMKDVLVQLGKKDVEIIDAKLGYEICSKEGCQVIVTGSFVRAGDVFVTDVKILDVTTKQILKSVSSKGNGVGSILETQIDELSKGIARGAGIPVLKVETAPMRIQDVTTNSMEAYKYYLKGLDAWSSAYWGDAVQWFEKAVSIDPDFATAYFYLFGSYSALQNSQKGREALEKAYQTSSRATENEQLLIHAWYAGAVQDDKKKQLDLLLELVEKAPRDKRVHFLLGLYYTYVQRPDEATEQFLKAAELDPSYGDAFNQLVYLYYRKGDTVRTMEYLQKYAISNPHDANPFDTGGDILMAMGKPDEAIEQYKQALKRKPDFDNTAEKIIRIYALKEDYPQANQWMENALKNAASESTIPYLYYSIAFMNYHFGKLNQAMTYLDKSVALGIGQEIKLIKADCGYLRFFIYYDLDQLEKAEKQNQEGLQYLSIADSSYHDTFYSDYYFLDGLIDIKKHRLDSAANNIQRIKAISQDLSIDYNYHYLLRELNIASAKKPADLDTITPIKVLPQYGSSYPWVLLYNIPFQRNSLAEAYLRFGMTDKAIEEYERLITYDPAAKGRRLLINPRYHYYLGILYQEKGMKEKAAEQFRKFLDLWQDADQSFPEPADAKRRLRE